MLKRMERKNEEEMIQNIFERIFLKNCIHYIGLHPVNLFRSFPYEKFI